MTATDKALPTTQVSLPSLTTEQQTESLSDASQPIPIPSEDFQATSDVPSLGGGQTQPEIPADPKVAALLAMFPDFDMSLLESVLESVAGDQDRAVDVLLGMSDPSYTSTERADVTQTELDEEIARRLMLEESEQQAAWRPQGGHVSSGHVPYQPRTGYIPSNDRQRSNEGDGVTQFQEQLGKFAETGKKTFNTLLSKVKAKIQEFDNSAGQAQPSTSRQPPPHEDSWSTPMQSQVYNDPNHPVSVQGYDLGTTVISGQPPMSTANQPVIAAQPMTSDTLGVSSSPTVPGVASSNIDHCEGFTRTVRPIESNFSSVAKLGLLPRRPVALGSSAQPSRNIADDDEVEYVENPFEESAHR